MGERQFGPYRLVQQVAVGGMAEIHLAKTGGIAGFEKYVALKMIHPNFSQDEQFIQMLIDEAKITVQLQHVNVAQTFDLGRVGETFYITMEYVDGCDLYQLLRRSAEHGRDMPFDIAAFVAKEVAMGLDYAHRKRDHAGRPLGIVHRDVSPQNVLISHAGEVKLVDFGIAKATMRARQTAVGVIKGKYYYMSPEQAWGEDLDRRTDIFSAGILLYEMLTGQMLYLEEDMNRLLGRVRQADIAAPSSLRRGIPPQLERIAMHALERSADDRYQTAADLAVDLERFLHVYSPVFAASKLARYVAEITSKDAEAPQPPAAPPDALRTARRVTQRVDDRHVARSRDEFRDENSVIFKVQELTAAATRNSARMAPRDRGASTREVRPRDDELGFDRTVVDMAPPSFGTGIVGPFTTSRNVLDADISDSLAGEIAADDAPTAARRAPLRGRFVRHASQPPDDPLDAETRRRPSTPLATSANDVLAAQNPRPAQSLLRAPRESRRTPGHDTHAAGFEPGANPALAPATIDEGLGLHQHGAHAAERATDPFSPPAPLPRPQLHAPEPARNVEVDWNTDRVRALDDAELPEEFRVGRGGVPRWVWPAGLAAVCVAAGIAIGLLVLDRPPPASRGALEIVSIPPGATISLDGVVQPDPAPLVVRDLAPGARYVITAELAGYRRWEQAELIPREGGTVKRIAALKPVVVTLHVESTPPGAEVFLNNRSVGRTPLTLPRLDPGAARVVEVRHRGYRPQRRPLNWSDRSEQRQQFTLEK